jgi:2-polyprenylphenol 6-hydroxylase
MSRDFDVVIVGGGIIGAVMASLLLARKLCDSGRVAVVADHAGAGGGSAGSADPGTDWGLRVFALSRASQRLLELTGIWQRLPAQRVFPYERMCVWDAGGHPDGPGSLTFDCAEIGEANLGCIVDGHALQECCLQAARAAGAVIIEAGVQEIALGDADARIRLKDGRDLAATLLIAADGTESKTRALLGIDSAGHAYHQDALVAHVRTGKPHRSTAWQRFLATGPLAFLPLSDGRSSIVWSVERAEATRLRALEAAEFAAALKAASDAVLGDLELATAVAGFPLKLQYAVDYARPRAVLLGDAAHAVHPLAGQGVNLGLRDVAELRDTLLAARAAGRDIGAEHVLRRYARRRRSADTLDAMGFDALARIYAWQSPALVATRGFGVRLLDHLAPLKRRIAGHAAGL